MGAKRSLEELLEAVTAHEEFIDAVDWTKPQDSLCFEMARRLRKLAERHKHQPHAGIPEGECAGCWMTWPCPDAEILEGR